MPLKDSIKGFLGPIGDDLPSLIPLVFALTIFFYIFTSTWNTFDKQNRSFSEDISLLRVASVLRANSYIPSYETFLERCEKAKAFKEVRFNAGLLPLAVREEEHFPGIDVENIEFFSDTFKGDVIYQCSNVPEQEQEISAEQHEIFVRFLPVALERDYKDNEGKSHFFVKPMLLVVIIWK